MTSSDINEIPDRIGYYLAGFADGEGSFNLSFRKRKDYSQPWKVSLCFNVSQRDRVILALFKRHLKSARHVAVNPKGWCMVLRTLTDFRAIRENCLFRLKLQ